MAETAAPDRTTLAAFAASVVFLGSNFVAVRISNQELAPFWGAALRFGLASILAWIVLLALRQPLPRGRALAGAVLFGLLAFALNFGLLYVALRPGGVTSGTASVLFATIPLTTFLLAVAVRLEAPRLGAFLGGLAVLAGVAAMSLRGLDGAPAALLAAAAVASLCAALSGIVVKVFPRSHPFALNAVAMPVGALALGCASLLAGEHQALPRQAGTWGALAWLVTSSVVAFAAMVWVIGRWTASANAYGAVLQPLVTLPVAAWLAGESVSWTFLAGAALVLAGVYVGALRARPERGRRPAPQAA